MVISRRKPKNFGGKRPPWIFKPPRIEPESPRQETKVHISYKQMLQWFWVVAQSLCESEVLAPLLQLPGEPVALGRQYHLPVQQGVVSGPTGSLAFSGANSLVESNILFDFKAT